MKPPESPAPPKPPAPRDADKARRPQPDNTGARGGPAPPRRRRIGPEDEERGQQTTDKRFNRDD